MRHFAAVSAIVVPLFASSAWATAFINEIDYDQPGTDNNEFVELAGSAGQNLNGWTLEFVNGATNTVYQSIALPNFTFPNFTNTGWGFYLLGRPPIAPDYDFGSDNFIQNGAPDGIRLLDASSNVVHFVSYEGAMPGATDVVPPTVMDDNVTNGSIGKTGPTSSANSGTWVFDPSPTPHFLNGGEDLVPEPGSLSLLLAGACAMLRRRRDHR